MSIQVTNLSHRYSEKVVLELESWGVSERGHALILGRSGSGKSTLLHVLAGILQPTRGEVLVRGTALRSLAGSALDRFRGANIGIVLQRLHLIRAVSVRENLRLAQRLAGAAPDENRLRAVLESLGMLDKLHAYPHELSHGQAQRVAIARAVINRPGVILADEPTSNLDDANCREAIQLLIEQAQAHGACLIVATHDTRIREHFAEQLVLESQQ